MAEPNVYQEQIQRAMELPPEKKFYFNGFSIAISPMDVAIVLLHNNQPIAFLNGSHIAAKSLATAMLGLFNGFEKETGQTVPTSSQVTSGLSKETNEP